MLSGLFSRLGVLALCGCAVAPSLHAAEPAYARLNNLGVAYLNQQLNEKALAQFEQACKDDSTAPTPFVNAGIAYLYLRRIPEAEAAFQRASVLDPKSVRAWYGLGLAAFTDGNQDQALGGFRKAEALDPEDADIHYFLGSIEFSQNHYPEALDQYETALKLAPLNASAQFGLARVLQRMGKADEAREHVARFRQITEAKVGTLMGTTYGEQGRYARAQDVLLAPMTAAPMIPVQYVPVVAPAATAGGASGGGCVMAMNGGASRQLVVMEPGEGLRVYQVGADESLTPMPAAEIGLLVKGDGVACAVGDYDNDGKPDLALALKDRVVLFHNLGGGKFADVTSAVGIKSMNRPEGLTFVDFDHDGDLDLLVTGAPDAPGGGNANVLWRNNGNSTFTEWTKPAGFEGAGDTREAVLSDINNDRAVDLVVAEAQGAPAVYENQREGAFKRVALYEDASLLPVRSLAISDLNKDGWMDVIATHAGAPGLTVWRNVEGKRFERMTVELPGVTGAWGVTPVDFDNDGWIDLAVVVQTAEGTQLRVLRNMGPGGFQDVSAALGLDKVRFKDARSVMAADLDGKGAADLIVTDSAGTPTVLRNVGGNKNHSLRLDLAGLADNKSAIGTKVEVFADGNWQKFEVGGSSGYLGQGPMEVVAGLGASEHADIVRLLWPTGVPQDELNMADAKPVALTELDRRGSSCPVLFAWDGTKYRFITDVIGAAVIGHWVSPTERNKPDTDEWVKVDGRLLQPRNGELSVRFGEPMEEINYIDQLRMVAVDHPANTEAFPDERFLNDPPFASGKVTVASPGLRPLAGAWDDHGQDVLATLRTQDRQYVRDFTNLSYAGFANPHTLTLDLGAWNPANPLRLFAHGYIEYFSASSMYAAWQAGIKPESPSIEAELPDGRWQLVVPDAGFPAGLPRTIVWDLTGKLPAGTRRIRVKTNLQIYWDQMLVDNGPAAQPVHVTELPLSTAHLEFRGYPKQIELQTPGDLTYDYQQISATGPFGWQRGNYTRYGAVTPLLTGRDNRYVIFGSGEDIDAEFGTTALPALPAGWTRDYFFYADGYVKDMDFYEAMPFTVSALPFHGMTSYPYPAREHFPSGVGSVDYQLDWNDRMETGDRTQRYQFDYQPVLSEPILK